MDGVYHVSVETRSKSSGGCSAKSCADYIARLGKSKKHRDPVLHRESGHMPIWGERGRTAASRSAARAFWVKADLHERVNGRVYKVVVGALPNALSAKAQIALARQIAQALSTGVDGGNLPWTLAVHAGLDSEGRSRNPHFHLMISERVNDGLERTPELWFRRAAVRVKGRDPGSGGARKTRALKRRSWLHWVRVTIAALINRALQAAGLSVRVDHRSHAARGLTRQPQQKRWRPASWLEKHGSRTPRGDAIPAVRSKWTGPGLPTEPTLAPRAENAPLTTSSLSRLPSATQSRRPAADPVVTSSSEIASPIAPNAFPFVRLDVAPIAEKGIPLAVPPAGALAQPSQTAPEPMLLEKPGVQTSVDAFRGIIDCMAAPPVETRLMAERAGKPRSEVSRVVASPSALLEAEMESMPESHGPSPSRTPSSAPRTESRMVGNATAQTRPCVSGSRPFPEPLPGLQRQSGPGPLRRSISSIRWSRRESTQPQRIPSQPSAPQGGNLIVAKIERRGPTEVAHEAHHDAVLGEYPNAFGSARNSLRSQHRLLVLSDGRQVRDFGDWLEVLPGSGAPLPDTLTSLISETKRWSTVHLNGPESMRRTAWQALSAAGIQVFGHEPSDEDTAQLRQAPAEEHAAPTRTAEWDPLSQDCHPESPMP
jgi:hypothetical protein